VDVIAPGKILKDFDVWLMSARWWTDLQRKMLYNKMLYRNAKNRARLALRAIQVTHE